MKQVKNLLFDLGGVVIDIERQRCVDSLTALGMHNADEMIGLYRQSGPFLQLEAGALSPEEFCEQMRQHMPADVTDTQIQQAISNFIIDIPVHRLEALRMLRQRYGTYVLSNTNPIMFEGIIASLFEKEGLDIDAYFDGITVSYRAKKNKPEPEIFHYAERTMGIRPEETLFLDDSQHNLDAAAALGYQVALVPVGVEFTDILKQLNLL
ncbi:MAG: HAD family phosphatase [Bacteroidales bacterium]|nr:HAD family phosphatase [Bacteroidales bacterium]